MLKISTLAERIQFLTKKVATLAPQVGEKEERGKRRRQKERRERKEKKRGR